MFEKFRNPGTDTYDGTKMMAEMTGLAIEEVRWTAARMKELIGQGKSASDAGAIIKSEQAGKPWLKGVVPTPDEWR